MKTMAFLAKHGFDIQRSLDKGVPYLGRHEEARAMLHLASAPLASRGIIHNGPVLRDADQAFANMTRSQIQALLSNHKPGESSPTSDSGDNLSALYVRILSQNGQCLTNDQVRMVQSIVNNEFPACVYKVFHNDGNDPEAIHVRIHLPSLQNVVSVCTGFRAD